MCILFSFFSFLFFSVHLIIANVYDNRFLQCFVKYGILFALVFVLQKSYWTSDSESNAISVERRRVQIKSSILPNTVEYILINASMSEMGMTARTIDKAYQSLRLEHKPLFFSMRRLNTYNSDQIYLIFSCIPAWH